MRPLPQGATIGIIGGGQLGRMLAMAAARLAYRTIILEPDADCPAAQLSSRQIVADYDDAGALAELAKAADVVTYEFENVPVAAARRLEAHVPVHPAPLALETAQDRLAEKRHLNALSIPTARFLAVDGDRDLEEGLAALGGQGVLKTRRLGYDGKGQRVFRAGDGRPAAGTFEAMGAVPLILEEFIGFECEFSIIAARGRDGGFRAYDAARNLHREGILRVSTVPAGIPQAAADAAREHTRRLAESLGYVGVLGVEFFHLGGGRVAANEFAPRVHNSGHWTEAACLVSQFEQHIRAVAGLPLGSPRRHSDCEMHNLIGDEATDAVSLAAMPDAVVHLYGKREARPGRKMGHYTLLKRMDGDGPPTP
jgi:5-(carboxyamino)imidazole ribonucleotide synthase